MKTAKRVIGLRPTNQIGINPKDKIGATKVDLSLIPSSAVVFMAMGLAVGARKYGEYNWRVEPIKARGYLAAALRHIRQLLDGEDFDPVELVHHGAFALSTVAIYLDAMVHGTLIDDRPVPGRGGELINQMSAAIATQDSQELRKVLESIVNTPRDNGSDLRSASTTSIVRKPRSKAGKRVKMKKGKRHARRRA